MIRRSFRIGLALGLLAGLAFALAKMLGNRPHRPGEAPPVPAEPWPRLREELPVVVQPAAVPVAAPIIEPVAEPIIEPVVEETVEPAPATPAPAEQAVAEKAAAKKAVAKKAPAKRAPATKQAPAALWVEPSGDVCPTSHPVKAKLSSKIFHLPGMLNYERTKPDRCYRDAPAAESDGLRPAKR